MNDIETLKNENLRLRKEIEALRGGQRKMFEETTPIGFLQKLADDTFQRENQTNAWRNAPLESLDKLKNDLSGKVGELFAEMLCKKGLIECVYEGGDTNSTDGTYDIIIKSKKVEIKTAKLGKQKGFQHESLRLDGYDYLMFIDVTPSYLYLTILPRFDLTKRSDILGRTPHLRKGATDVYKLDFSESLLASLITKGFTKKVTDATSLEELKEFLNQKIV